MTTIEKNQQCIASKKCEAGRCSCHEIYGLPLLMNHQSFNHMADE